MAEKKHSFYEIMVYVAYGFFILLGLGWFSGSLFVGGFFNYWAFLIMVVFGLQAYFRHKLTNLILGVLTLPLSILGTLQFIWFGQKTGFDLFVNLMIVLSVIGFILSLVLVFS